MQTIKGIFAEARIMTDDAEEYAISQIRMIADNIVSEGSKIRVMPDVHPGKVGPVGLTMTMGDKVLPNLLGIDIGCGMLVCEVKATRCEFEKFDRIIKENIPSGSDIRKTVHHSADLAILEDLRSFNRINVSKAMRSLGTLGGGNHFIEVDKAGDKVYVVIHSGSRHLGKEVTEYYLDAGRRPDIPYEMTMLEGALADNYLHDVAVVTRYASENRRIMLDEILKGMKWREVDRFETIHNYISVEPDGTGILRKGSISAREGERLIIPINMRDGAILGIGKGNPEWNSSAPHGSGRRLRRDAVQDHYTLSAFKKDMKGIYSTSVSKDTLDEAPIAYRGMDDILPLIEDTVEVTGIIRPVYNYNAGSRR